MRRSKCNQLLKSARGKSGSYPFCVSTLAGFLKNKNNMKISCKCGCDKPITRSKLYPYDWNIFIHGHNRKDKIGSMSGKHHSQESIQKISKALKGHNVSRETKNKISKANTGKHLSKEHKQKISKFQKGKTAHNALPRETRICKCGCKKSFICNIHSTKKYFTHGHHCKDKPAHNKLFREIRICKCGCKKTFKCKTNSKQKYIWGHNSKGVSIPRTKKMKKERSISQLKKWQDPKYAKKQSKAIHKGLNHTITKPERRLKNRLNHLFPNKYKYVGNGSFWINGKNPDFININGQKKIIEMFGDYWHGKERTGRTRKQEKSQRIRHFAKHGFKTLIVWQSELENIEQLKRKLIKFHNERRF